MKKNKQQNVDKTVALIVEGLENKKGKEIVVLDLREIENRITDFYVICHGTSDTQVVALADSVEEHLLKTIKEKPWQVEGKNNAEWVLLDFVDVMVHIFKGDKREFYNLEDLWGDAKIKKIESSFSN